mmetsp:Transcript_42004/g.71030  ORF Transcript_42004/g.71030 Transcript_42004/m.71030 type:complete len:231 (+) Transcript_42004:417-1109(+)
MLDTTRHETTPHNVRRPCTPALRQRGAFRRSTAKTGTPPSSSTRVRTIYRTTRPHARARARTHVRARGEANTREPASRLNAAAQKPGRTVQGRRRLGWWFPGQCRTLLYGRTKEGVSSEHCGSVLRGGKLRPLTGPPSQPTPKRVSSCGTPVPRRDTTRQADAPATQCTTQRGTSAGARSRATQTQRHERPHRLQHNDTRTEGAAVPAQCGRRFLSVPKLRCARGPSCGH